MQRHSLASILVTTVTIFQCLWLSLYHVTAQSDQQTSLSVFLPVKASDEVQSLIQGYSKVHPSYRIEIHRTQSGELFDSLRVAVASGKVDGFDVMLISDQNLQTFARMGALADLTDPISKWSEKKQYYTNVWTGSTFQGRMYGVPVDSVITTLTYNSDILQRANVESPPTTWNQLQSIANRLTDSNRFGLCILTGAQPYGRAWSFLPFLW